MSFLAQIDPPWYAGVLATLALAISGAVAGVLKLSNRRQKNQEHEMTQTLQAISAIGATVKRVEEGQEKLGKQLQDSRDLLRDLHVWNRVAEENRKRIEDALKRTESLIQDLVREVKRSEGL